MSKPRMTKRALAYVTRAIERNEISNGDYILQFEEGFASYTGATYASAVCNGTMAIYVALKAAGVQKDDEVIMPTLTFAATADAVLMTGAVPVFVDIDENFSLNIEAVRECMNPKVRAIITVDLYGVPTDAAPLRDFGVPIIRDACESLGAPRDIAKNFRDADFTCYSFYGNKVMTTGEGGMVCTPYGDRKNLIDKYRNHGRSSGYWHELQGTNARMSNIAAAMGLAQLHDLPQNLERRWKLLECYELPPIASVRNAPWFAIAYFGSADAAVAYLRTHHVDARAGFKPLHTMPAYSQYKKSSRMAVSEVMGCCIVMLPLFPDLTMREVEHIRALLRDI